ncbi:MAG: helix-turn-helix domain-containing protein [Bacilli bacterium]|jgi:transcriptional regulator with XRE-family HTH domain|nr:helix-turn-helix domain-containing protein [Bacilli bacterium]
MNRVGQMLQEQREKLGISIDEVSKKTKIQPIYLDAIEKGDFAFFQNQEFYQQIFVGSYAKFLGLDKDELLNQLVDDNNDYLLNPTKEGFAPKFADEIIEKQHVNENVQEQEPIITEEAEVVEEESTQPEPEEETMVNTHSNPHILEKYMYQMEDPKLKELEEQIKAKKEAEALKAEEESQKENINDDIFKSDEVEEDTIIKEPINDNAASLDEIVEPSIDVPTEEVVLPVDEDEVIEKEEEEVTDLPYDDITLNVNEPSLEELALENSQSHDISSLLDEIENEEVDLANEPSIGEIIDESNETTIDSQSELEDVLASLNKQAEIEEEKVEEQPEEAAEDEIVLNEPTLSIDDAINDNSESVSEDVNEQEVNEAQPITLDDLDHVSEATGNTEVIDLTSGIDIEKIDASEKPQVENDIFKNLDEALSGNLDGNKEEEKISKTAIDLKVAKALGESNLDKADLKKAKRERVINIIFIILIIILLCYVAYLGYRAFFGN